MVLSVLLNNKNNKAFSLVELLVALVIIMISMMALMKTSIFVIKNNLRNEIRNTAVEILSNHISDLVGMNYDNITTDNLTVTKKIRSFNETFKIMDVVIDNNSVKYIHSTIKWVYLGKPYKYATDTVVGKP